MNDNSESNSMLISALSIARRQGEQTNWDAYQKKIEKELDRQRSQIVYPDDHLPVLARISHVSSTGKSGWFEVVYYDNEKHSWNSYAGSNTFKDGEQVIKWRYIEDWHYV